MGGPVLYLYVEGDDVLKTPFQRFFAHQRKRLHGRYAFLVVMEGSNSQTVDRWRWRRTHRDEQDIVLLLLDSEGEVGASDFEVPAGCRAFLTVDDLQSGDVFFMTQLMESWFLTHVEKLASIYGKEFDARRLPAVPKAKRPTAAGKAVEAVPKQNVLTGLSAATRETLKGAYERTRAKTTVAPEMLEEMVASRVAESSYHLRRLLERLEGA